MNGRAEAKLQQNRSQQDCLNGYLQRNQRKGEGDDKSKSSVSEAMEDAVLFMVKYLVDVQGPKHVTGRDFALIAASPEARRLFLCTARHLMLQLIRENVELTVTNFHDLLRIMCRDFQMRVVKSAFKAAWVVLRERPRSQTPRLPFDKFWKCLELTWLYEPYFLSVRRYVFGSSSHDVKISAQVKHAVAEVETYIRQEGWPAIPTDIMKEAIARASTPHGDSMVCQFDGIVRALCVSDKLRHHIKMENHPTTLGARQAAIAAATALAEDRRRRKLAAAARDGGLADQTDSMDRVTSYGSFGMNSLDRTTSFGSGSGSPRSATSFDVRNSFERMSLAMPQPNITRSKESSISSGSTSGSGGKGSGSATPTTRIVPVDSRVPHSPADSVSEISSGHVPELKISEAMQRPAEMSEIQPCD